MDKTKKASQESFFHDAVRRYLRHRVAMVSLVVFIVEIAAVIFLPYILKLDPYTTNAGFFDAGPSARFPLGTDSIGRDVFARLVYGGRVSLAVGFLATIISTLIGVPLGLVAGYYPGVIREIIMRLVDIFMSFPALVIQLVMVMLLGASAASVTLVLGFLGWTNFARLTYSSVIQVKEMEYIEAARSNGAADGRIMFQYILPNCLSPIFVRFSFNVAASILAESGLSFLGLGVQQPTATWGNMIYAAQTLSTLRFRPWVWLPPGLMIIITVLAINFIGDGLRDALDPKMKL